VNLKIARAFWDLHGSVQKIYLFPARAAGTSHGANWLTSLNPTQKLSPLWAKVASYEVEVVDMLRPMF
jgi:hypothetical protein